MDQAALPVPDSALRLALVVHRHGLRTPLTPLGPLDDAQWECKGEDVFISEGPNRPVHLMAMQHVERVSRCYAGQLTPTGAAQMQAVGQRLRQRYVLGSAAMRLLPTGPLTRDSAALLGLRSTMMPRTLRSVMRVGEGLVPDREVGVMVPVETRVFHDETMWANAQKCGVLRDFWRQRVRRTDVHLPQDALRAKLATVLGDADLVESSRIEGLFNSAESAVAHGHFIGERLGPVMGELQAGADRATNFVYGNRAYSRLVIGPFLGELMSVVDGKVDGCRGAGLDTPAWEADREGKPTVRLYSCHDTSVAPLMALLDVQRGHPPMGSTVTMELWQRPRDDSWRIRLLFKDRVVMPQALQGDADAVGSVPLEPFRVLAWGGVPSAKELRDVCRLTKADDVPGVGDR